MFEENMQKPDNLICLALNISEFKKKWKRNSVSFCGLLGRNW